MSFTAVTVTGTFESAPGVFLAGTVTFELSAPMQDATDKTIIEPEVITATLSASGAISVVLSANDDTTTTPTGAAMTFYTVTERLNGVPERSYPITVLHADSVSGMDLGALAP